VVIRLLLREGLALLYELPLRMVLLLVVIIL